jgi:hypothetical protein
VESAIPLLAQACGIVLPTGSSGGSSGTSARSGMGDGSGMLPAADDDHDLGDRHDSAAIELACTGGGSMGPRRGSGGTAHGEGAGGTTAY